MSDTQATPETAVQEVTPEVIVETPTEETTATEETKAPQADRPRGERGRGDRKPRRDGGRGGIREEQKEFREEMLEIARVTRVTAGGRQLRFRAAIVIGDGKGRVGLGIGKSGEVQGAIEKAIRDAKKNLVTFSMHGDTIAHDVAVNFKSSSLFLHPAHPGTGIIAGGAVRKIFAVSGIKDIIAKQHGAPNPITNARVAMKALSALKPASQIKSFASQVEKTEQAETVEKKAEVKKEAVEKKTETKKAPVKKETAEKKPVAKKAPAKKKAE